MPGQIISVPFVSQIEDMDKYLTEYRSLKLMPQNAAGPLQHGHGHVQGQQQHQYRHQGRSSSQGVAGQQRKRMGHNETNGMNQYNGGGEAANIGTAGKRFQMNNSAHVKYGSGQHFGTIGGAASFQGYQKGYPQMFYHGVGKLGCNDSAIGLSMLSAAQQPVQQQGFMASSSSSGSASPSRLQTSMSGTSTVNSMGSEFGDNMMTGDLHSHYDSLGFSQVSAASPAVNDFNLESTFVKSSSSSTSSASTSNDFMQVLPSSLLGDAGVNNNVLAGKRSMAASMFSPAQFASSSNQSSFTMMHTTASTWASPSSVSASGSATVNQPNTSSASSGSFGIWNNDMSVWG
ncbi:HDL295Cp [Eremothecium sinecaudum]|uniref:HDL295Cp n=1 Tax=Eremothecium sinecaudum TaxID=45286 RepID=A0A0X8HS49_9SACH|nr:HDL295Cp [Eremothecium sinecaudum]AMD20449.1 HDL295Cp [Eremothecium sinecaudum]